jgi:4-alpha-glucanotransferase
LLPPAKGRTGRAPAPPAVKDPDMTNANQPSARSAGLLLHPTSLPGPYGIGDLGPAAASWVDALVRARQTWWQVLPLGPTGFADSPYQAVSTFAGNPLLVSPDLLVQDGLLEEADLSVPNLPADRVDFEAVGAFKRGLLARAWENFRGNPESPLHAAFEEFIARQSRWLDDFTLFMALKEEEQETEDWTEWPKELVQRQPAALARARQRLAGAIGLQQFSQFLFFRQWQNLKRYCHERGVRIIGDIPIFVAADSADVWANPQLFQLDEHRKPRVVAGVPPDYFSRTGQLWGNPLYDWEALRSSGYSWWVARLQATLELVDLVRLDHFRGFEAYWEIPAGNPTAEVGRWVKAPGADFLRTAKSVLGGLPLIAEDLGLITPEVEALRDEFGLPGMRILQFAFSDGKNPYLPHNFTQRTVVYTGTHDNDTTVGWFATLPGHERAYLERYLPHVSAPTVAWDLIRLVWGSVADYALAPLQDVFGLGSEARMNMPGEAEGNWQWRFSADQLTPELLDRLADLTEVYNR